MQGYNNKKNEGFEFIIRAKVLFSNNTTLGKKYFFEKYNNYNLIIAALLYCLLHFE